MREELAAQFSELRSRLRALNTAYDSTDKNLHFEPLPRADPALYEALLGLAQEGLQKVRDHREFFSKTALYADGMFWYDLFLMISAAAQRVHADRRQRAIPSHTVSALIDTLVAISEFTVPPPLVGDITKRNFEALGNTLWAFWRHDLREAARRAAHRIDCKAVGRFVQQVLAHVRKVRERPSKVRARPPKHRPGEQLRLNFE